MRDLVYYAHRGLAKYALSKLRNVIIWVRVHHGLDSTYDREDAASGSLSALGADSLEVFGIRWGFFHFNS